MCSVEIEELGHELRARRAAAGRTIASVAVDAGLSVPYIANLENGRGNPTLSALASLSRALGAELRVDLAERSDEQLPESLIAFARTPRFTGEAQGNGRRLLHAMAAMGALSPRALTDLDWHRLLDAVILISRAETPAATG
jgi:transcriptional regulator with XRE-family HTH domain